MNEHRSSTSEGIWIGLCVLLLFLLAGVGGFGYMQFQRANAAVEMARKAQADAEMQRQNAERAAMRQALAVARLQVKNFELEAENQKLRQQLNGEGE